MSRRVRRRLFERIAIFQPSSGTIIDLPTRYVLGLSGPEESEEYTRLASGSKLPTRRTMRVQVPVTHKELALFGEIFHRTKCPVQAAFIGGADTDNWLWLEPVRLQVRDPEISGGLQAEKVFDLESSVFYPGIWESTDLIGGVPWQGTKGHEFTDLAGKPVRLEPEGNPRLGYQGPGWEVDAESDTVDSVGESSLSSEATLRFNFPMWGATLRVDTLLGYQLSGVVVNALDFNRSVLKSVTGSAGTTITLPDRTWAVEVRVSSSSSRPKILVDSVGYQKARVLAGGVSPDCTRVDDPDYQPLPIPNEAPQWEQRENLVWGKNNTAPTFTSCGDYEVSEALTGGDNTPPSFTSCNDYEVSEELTETEEETSLTYTAPTVSDTKKIFTSSGVVDRFDYCCSNFQTLFSDKTTAEVAIAHSDGYIFIGVPDGIERYDLSGGNQVTLESGTGRTVTGMCVDPFTDALYVSYENTGGIYWMNYDGSSRSEVISDAGQNYSLVCAPDGGNGGYIFGISGEEGELARWPLAGGARAQLIDVSSKSYDTLPNLHLHLSRQFLFFQIYEETNERNIVRSDFKGNNLTGISYTYSSVDVYDETFWSILEHEEKFIQVEGPSLIRRNLDGSGYAERSINRSEEADYVQSAANFSGGNATSGP